MKTPDARVKRQVAQAEGYDCRKRAANVPSGTNCTGVGKRFVLNRNESAPRWLSRDSS